MERPVKNPSYVSAAGQDESAVSDCESVVSGGETAIDRGFVSAGEGGDLVRTIFVGNLGGLKPEVVAVRRNAHSSVMAQARAQSFQIFAHAVAKLRDGNANLKFAWYGASGEEEIADILQNGFGHAHSNALRLSSRDSPLESVKRSVADRAGLRHLLLCRVILGKTEVVPCGSDQCRSSSEEYDSGVDDLSDPKQYIIWCNRMNTHVLPEYVLSFRLPSLKGSLKGHVKIGELLRLRSALPRVPFPTLILMLSKILPRRDVAFIAKLQEDYNKKRISRHEMIQKVRIIAGDKLLFSVIKAFGAKKYMQDLKQKGERMATGQPAVGTE